MRCLLVVRLFVCFSCDWDANCSCEQQSWAKVIELGGLLIAPLRALGALALFSEHHTISISHTFSRPQYRLFFNDFTLSLESIYLNRDAAENGSYDDEAEIDRENIENVDKANKSKRQVFHAELRE